MSRSQSLIPRALLAIMLAVFANLVADMTFSQPVLAYNCGTESRFHCYGTHTWNGGTTGAETRIKVVNLTAGNLGMGHALWLLDTSQYQLAWVEGGYFDDWDDGVAMRYYFADMRPGYTFQKTPLDPVPSADLNRDVLVKFWKNSTSFSVVIDSYTKYWAPYSNPNQMNASRIDIGSELAGSSGASAATAYWNGNKWRNPSGSWFYQNRAGDYNSIYWPPNAAWQTLPSQSSIGGSWKSWCC